MSRTSARPIGRLLQPRVRDQAGRGGLPLTLAVTLLLSPTLARADDSDDFDAPIQVLVTSPRPVIIAERPLGGSQTLQWSIPATPPGGGFPLQLRSRSELEILGAGVSRFEFRLEDSPLPARLQIKPGSRRYRLLGLVIGMASSAIAPFALDTFAISGYSTRSEHQVGPPGWMSTNQRLALASGISLTLSLVGIVAGWTMYGTSGTDVEQGPP